MNTYLLRYWFSWRHVWSLAAWTFFATSGWAIQVYPNLEAPNPLAPPNFHARGITATTPQENGGAVTIASADGMFLYDFPHPAQKPPDQVNVSFNWDFTLTAIGAGFSFNFGAIGLDDFHHPTSGAGGGLTMTFVSLKEQPAAGDVDGGQITVLWRGSIIARTNADIGHYSWSGDGPHLCAVNYTTAGGLIVDVQRSGSIIRLVNGYKPLAGPEADWRFGFIGEAFSGFLRDIKITASEPPSILPALTNRFSLQDQPDALQFTIETLEKSDDFRIVLESSNSASFQPMIIKCRRPLLPPVSSN